MNGPALLAAILDHPGCDTRRLVYADWLDRAGEPERAEFIRVQCELARLSAEMDECLKAGLPHTDPGREGVRRRLFARSEAGRHLLSNYWDKWLPPAGGAAPYRLMFGCGTLTIDDDRLGYVFRRGFVLVLRGRLVGVRGHLPALVAREPVERVEAADWRPRRRTEPAHVAGLPTFAITRPRGRMPPRPETGEVPAEVYDRLAACDHDGGAAGKYYRTGERAAAALSAALLAEARGRVAANAEV